MQTERETVRWVRRSGESGLGRVGHLRKVELLLFAPFIASVIISAMVRWVSSEWQRIQGCFLVFMNDRRYKRVKYMIYKGCFDGG